MRFLVDAQLPPALAQWLTDHGQEAAAVRDIGLHRADDGDIWSFARRGGWMVVSKDEDFIEFALQAVAGPQIVWLRIGNCTNPVLFAWLAPLLPQILQSLEAGNRIVEVRRDDCPAG